MIINHLMPYFFFRHRNTNLVYIASCHVCCIEKLTCDLHTLHHTTMDSINFKSMLCRKDRETRRQILDMLLTWLQTQFAIDPRATACWNSLQEAMAVNGYASNSEFKDHYLWFSMSNHNTCPSFQKIVKARLDVSKIKQDPPPAASAPSPPAQGKAPRIRKTIPKKMRGEVWKKEFGEAPTGACVCCDIPLSFFDSWHVGHIVAVANGGMDTIDNLRPVCSSCNLSMGTENMDDFKRRCYPATENPLPE
jgi:hypothetical protein